MYEDIAQCLMDHAQRLPLGNCNEKQPYSHRHLEWITVTAGAFFDKYPKLLTDEVLETLAIGKPSTKLKQFGHLKEFYPLNKALEGYSAYLHPKLKKTPFWAALRTLIGWISPQITTQAPYKPAPVNH